jgi:GNAT superfamily N-acetyltransferase
MATANIRPATCDDIPAMLSALRKHHAAHGFEWPFDRVRLSIVCAHAIDAPDWLALVDDDALLLARWFECEFGSGRHAIERALWSERGQGPALIAEYERWARATGCVDAALSSMRRPDAFARLYGRLGYRVAETTFVKPLRTIA